VAGLLAHSHSDTFPALRQWLSIRVLAEFTAAGTAPKFHRIPSRSHFRDTNIGDKDAHFLRGIEFLAEKECWVDAKKGMLTHTLFKQTNKLVLLLKKLTILF